VVISVSEIYTASFFVVEVKMEAYFSLETFQTSHTHYKLVEKQSIYVNIVDFINGSLYQWREVTVSFVQFSVTADGEPIFVGTTSDTQTSQ
jgi:hypothetical protein